MNIQIVEISEVIKTSLDEANLLRQENKLRDAKQKYLDAASQALEISKTTNDNIEKLSYEKLTGALIQEAKDCQSELFLVDLPKTPLDHTKKKPKSSGDGLLIRKRPDVYALFVIRDGGIPVITYHFKEIKEKMEGEINEILFSGAMTAISSLMREALNRPIQMINFEDGVLLIRALGLTSFVLFARESSPGLNKALNEFYKALTEETEYDFDSPMFIRDLSNDEVVIAIIHRIFIRNEQKS